MEIGNITKLTVGAVVAILVIVGVMIPITGGLSHEETVEGINEMTTSGLVSTYGRYRYTEEFTATSTGGKAIDGVSLAEIFESGGGRYLITNLGIISTSGSNYTYYAAEAVTGVTTITLANGTLTYTAGGTDTTVDGVHWAYIPSGDGPYIQTSFKEGYYVNEDDEIVQFNVSASRTGAAYGTALTRTVDAYWINGVNDPTQVTGSFVPIQKGTTTVYGIASSVPTNLIIPEKYTYTQTVGESGPAWEMIAVIPLIAIVALVAMVAGAIWRNRE